MSPACQLFKLLDQVEVKSETFLRPAQYCSSSHSMAACLSLHPLVFRIPFPHSLSCPHLLILCQVKPLLWALFMSQHQISLSLLTTALTSLALLLLVAFVVLTFHVYVIPVMVDNYRLFQSFLHPKEYL